MKIDLQTRKIIIWILLTESMLILSTRLGAFLHESVGHGLMAELFGGRFEAFRLTLFAGGEAKYSGNFGEMASLCVSLGGIIVNLITGLVILLLIQKRRFSFSFILFGIFLAGVSILSQIQYLILGAYYKYGDPVCLAKYPVALFLAWTGGLVLLAYFSWYLMRLFFQFQDAYFPSSHLFNKAIISFLILCLPVFMYAGFYHYSKTPLGSTAAIKETRTRFQKEAERIKAETKTEQSIEEIRRRLEPYPILPLIFAIYFLTTIIAFLRPAKPGREKYFSPIPLSFVYCFSWVLVAGSVLALIAFLW